MAGVLLAWLVLECHMPSLHHLQAGLEYDISLSVHWTIKYSAKSLWAGHLLWALALRQQICGSASFLVIPIQGILNTMADVASRYSSDKTMQAKSTSLLSYFNTHFKQESSSEQFPLPPKLLSHVMSSLLGKHWRCSRGVNFLDLWKILEAWCLCKFRLSRPASR